MAKRTWTASDSERSGDECPKLVCASEDEQARPVVRCTLPPHCSASPTAFESYADFERHYAEAHSLVCAECKRVFPSSRFLDLHLSEWHDPFVDARRERGEKVYACFVEGCDKLCLTPGKRRMHLVDKHAYPKEYMFNIVRWGIQKNQKSLLHRPRKHVPAPVSSSGSDMETEPSGPDDPEEPGLDGEPELVGEPELEADLAAINNRLEGVTLVPSKIRFGHKR